MDAMNLIYVGELFDAFNMALEADFFGDLGVSSCNIEMALRAINTYFQIRFMVKLEASMLNSLSWNSMAHITARNGMTSFGSFEMTCEANIFVDDKMFLFFAPGMTACAAKLFSSFQIIKVVGMIERDMHSESGLFLEILSFMTIQTNIVVHLCPRAGVV